MGTEFAYLDLMLADVFVNNQINLTFDDNHLKNL